MVIDPGLRRLASRQCGLSVFQEFFHHDSGVSGHETETPDQDLEFPKDMADVDAVSSGIEAGGAGMALLVGDAAGNPYFTMRRPQRD